MNGVCKVKGKLFRLYNNITIHLSILSIFVEYPSACTPESYEEEVDYFQIIDGELSRSCVFISSLF